ncbi:MAG TPA: NADH:ubiquinone oxidoreductase [Marinilabiliales bacterium]|jgi:Ni,Fe-hydrogenase III small subunit|nr:MAG: NADH:ubiquinone oxidoreductase [Bacteroidetes bacterium GWA2_40_14]OFX66185.1 MAG: NADH:ubiquinone oxidoreductase [Bacteroidetes bacterium GWC2_40_13]OFX74529.1 MAG: NADH:ubiquinone oxidoreductase [Bacteroidetes bacterium GWD2_40_43]OFX92042.1 MAG: NADH:ubiquinone oxidoreductase [Bacteroidetes bacterium GWE2_40_63]OFY16666.1 MAG: NADH:ubiquinone oxidoreductase [Bacteroidetes bacterium GWF2_40_13]OFZ27040.1 MAG: NADH:ubiquinone oxidoreductase [Bacteroidetes bacterium RIFOXYC2_FULL_40_12
MLEVFKIWFHQGKQYIPDVTTVEVPGIFRGRPIITTQPIDEKQLVELCPTGAIGASPVSIDLGRCTFCGECAIQFPEKISFTKDFKLATNQRSRLIVKEGDMNPITVNPELIRKEIYRLFRGSLKLRQVSAGGDNSCEWELNAVSNVNFDMGRFGIEFVASPRHADGLVITGPITENMAEPLRIAYEATPEPKIIIVAGVDAISGGIFEGSPALNRSFLDKYPIALYIPGNPVHPLSFINGVLSLIRTKTK